MQMFEVFKVSKCIIWTNQTHVVEIKSVTIDMFIKELYEGEQAKFKSIGMSMVEY